MVEKIIAFRRETSCLSSLNVNKNYCMSSNLLPLVLIHWDAVQVQRVFVAVWHRWISTLEPGLTKFSILTVLWKYFLTTPLHNRLPSVHLYILCLCQDELLHFMIFRLLRVSELLLSQTLLNWQMCGILKTQINKISSEKYLKLSDINVFFKCTVLTTPWCAVVLTVQLKESSVGLQITSIKVFCISKWRNLSINNIYYYR